MLRTVMIIEDDKNMQQYLASLLTQENYSVIQVKNEMETLPLLEKNLPDIVILDLMLPNLKGEALCKEIKEDYPDLPVVILTGKTDQNDKIQGLSMGADDYITKPFEPEELLLRIKARLKENSPNTRILKIDDLEMNTMDYSVKRGGKDLSLTPQEYKLLEYLMTNQGRVLTRENLLSKIWPNSFDVETRVIDVYISYLRRKIDKNAQNKLIHSVRGFGYIIKDKSKDN